VPEGASASVQADDKYRAFHIILRCLWPQLEPVPIGCYIRKKKDSFLRRSQREELNAPSADYKSAALTLSYTGINCEILNRTGTKTSSTKFHDRLTLSSQSGRGAPCEIRACKMATKSCMV
jgi:hypothetical protein